MSWPNTENTKHQIGDYRYYRYHGPRRMAAVYTVLAKLLYKNIVLCVTNDNYKTLDKGNYC